LSSLSPLDAIDRLLRGFYALGKLRLSETLLLAHGLDPRAVGRG
jgi:hypothetical protein